MHYYKRNLGDYAKKAGRLSMLQHGSYTLLIDACYDREQFPTLEEAIDWTWASSTAEIEAVEFILRKFFVLDGDRYVQKRIQEEIAEYRGKAETNARIAQERETKRREKSTVRAQVVDEAPPNQEPRTINQEPRTNTPPSGGAARKRSAARPGDVPEPVWRDFQAIRKAKRAPLTDTALDGIRREAEKAGVTFADAIAYCCEVGWQGFNATWYAERHAGGGRRAPPESFREIDRRAAAERVAQFAPRIADKTALRIAPIDVEEVRNAPAIESR